MNALENTARPNTPPDENLSHHTSGHPDKTNYASVDQEALDSHGKNFPKTNEIFHNTNTSTSTNFSHSQFVAHFVARVRSLLLWENPLASSLALFGSLGLLILTSYVSLFRLFCATATIVIGCNWAYVNLMMHGQRVFAGTDGVNPHTRFINTEPIIPHARVEQAVNFAVDLMNSAMHEAAKIALIDDNIRSVRYFFVFYLVWTLSTYIPTKWLIGTALVGAFTGPKIYLQNSHLIDKQVKRWDHTARVNANNAIATTKHHTRSLYDKIRSFADKHRLPAAASKVESTFKANMPTLKEE